MRRPSPSTWLVATWLVALAPLLAGCDAMWEAGQGGARAIHVVLPVLLAASLVPSALAVVHVFRRNGAVGWLIGAGVLALVGVCAAAVVTGRFAWSPGAVGHGSLGILYASIAPVLWLGLATAAILRRAKPGTGPASGDPGRAVLAVVAGIAPASLYAILVVLLAHHDVLPARPPASVTIVKHDGFAVQADGSVVRWSPSSRRHVDAQLAGMTALASSPYWTCAMLADHRAACFWDDAKHWLPDVADVEEIALDRTRVCVRRASHAVDCQALPQPGDRPREPVFGAWHRVARLEATRLASNDEAFCAVRTGGAVACWGVGTMLLPREGEVATPEDVPGLDHVARVALARMYGCAFDVSGRARCWGRDDLRRPALPDDPNGVPTPVEVPGWASARDVSSAGDTVCVVTAAGRVSCLHPPYLDIADHPLGPLDHPVDVDLPGRAAQVFAGDSDVCARLEDGSVWCFGSDAFGELLGEEPRNCQQDNLRLTVTPCVDSPQRFVLDE